MIYRTRILNTFQKLLLSFRPQKRSSTQGAMVCIVLCVTTYQNYDRVNGFSNYQQDQHNALFDYIHFRWCIHRSCMKCPFRRNWRKCIFMNLIIKICTELLWLICTIGINSISWMYDLREMPAFAFQATARSLRQAMGRMKVLLGLEYW